MTRQDALDLTELALAKGDWERFDKISQWLTQDLERTEAVQKYIKHNQLKSQAAQLRSSPVVENTTSSRPADLEVITREETNKAVQYFEGTKKGIKGHVANKVRTRLRLPDDMFYGQIVGYVEEVLFDIGWVESE